MLVLVLLMFLQLTILLPCWDSFASEALRDRMPDEQWDSRSVRTAGLRISQIWGLVLTLCTIATLVGAWFVFVYVFLRQDIGSEV